MAAKKSNSKKSSTGYGVLFKGRRTGVLVSATSRSNAITQAKQRKRRGSDEVESVWKLTPNQLKQARAGKWVNTVGRSEKRLTERRGQGPKPKGFKK